MIGDSHLDPTELSLLGVRVLELGQIYNVPTRAIEMFGAAGRQR